MSAAGNDYDYYVNPESNGAIAGTIYSYLVDGNLVHTLTAVLSEVFVYRKLV